MSEHPLRLMWDARAAAKSPEAIAQRQDARFADAAAFARTHSPFYRQLYADVPEQFNDPTALPPTSKPELMAHFAEWVTD